MSHLGLAETELADLYELNLSFLSLLVRRAQAGASCLGLDRHSRVLSRLETDGVEPLARVPRALFNLSYQVGRPLAVADSPPDPLEAERRAFAAGALLATWQLARRRPAVAQLLYGLSSADTATLSTARVGELVSHAFDGNTLSCALLEEPCVWDRALSAPIGAHKRRMVLVMLARFEPLPSTLGVSLSGVA